MSDIVERLRRPASFLTIEEGTEMHREAAAEIERLRAALAEIAAHDDQFSSADQARAMRDSARRALEAER